MNEAKQVKCDKSAWGAGPWQSEPDREEWRHNGVPCLAVRHPRLGHWCGYVGVPPGHPLFGKDYGDAPDSLDVHGGLTFAGKCHGNICHTPLPGEPEVWWLGFDCAHCGDQSPGMNMHRSSLTMGLGLLDAFLGEDGSGDEYKTLAWVKAETQRLADQLIRPSAVPLSVEEHLK